MSKALSKAFGLVLRSYRERRNWSQLELAEKADLHLNTIGMFERGERSPSLSTIFHLCHVLDVPAGKFVATVQDRLGQRGG